MRASIRILVWRGIVVGAHWSLILVAGLLSWSLADEGLPRGAPGYSTAAYWVAGTATALAFLASIAAHELGHAVVAQRRGIPVQRITLWLFGGVAELGRQPTTWQSELAVAVAGPVVSLTVGTAALGAGLATGASTTAELAADSLVWLGTTNLVLAAFNLLPGAPLDGGRVFTALRWRHHGDARRARQDGARAGMVLANVLVGTGVVLALTGLVGSGLWLVFLGWFLGSAARAELDSEAARHELAGIRVADLMTPAPVTVPPWLTLEALVTDVLPVVHGTTIPVTSDGQLLGLVTPDHLRRTPPSRWDRTPVLTVATPAADVPVVHPEEDLVAVLERTGGAPARFVVVDRGRVVGVITPTDVARALQLAALRRTLAGALHR